MRVYNIQDTNFQSKQRFVTPAAKENINFLINKMRETTKYKTDGYCFKSTIFKELSDSKKEARFIDGLVYTGDKLKRNTMKGGETLFTIGKTELVIDNNSGEIIDYYKPFYKTWNGIMKKIDEFVTFFKENFENDNLVYKRYLTNAGFTEEGLKRFRKLSGVNLVGHNNG